MFIDYLIKGKQKIKPYLIREKDEYTKQLWKDIKQFVATVYFLNNKILTI